MKHTKIINLCLLFSLLAALLCGCVASSDATLPSTETTGGSVNLDQGTGDSTEEHTQPSQGATDSTQDATVPSDEPAESPTEEPNVPAETPVTTPSDPAVTTFSIVGTWTSVRRDGNELNVKYLTFEADGTGHAGGTCYMNVHGAMEVNPDCEADENGWYVAPMGYPYDYFTYTLENGVLSITYTGCDYEDYVDFTNTHTLQVLGNGLINLNDGYGKYTQQCLALKDLCALMGVNYDPPAADALALLGRWHTVHRTPDDTLVVNSWVFGEDGYASPYGTGYHHSSKKTEGIIYFEPNEDGWCEVWDESNDQIYTYTLDNDVLTLVFVWGEHMAPEDAGYTTTFTVEWLNDNTVMLIGNGERITYVRDDDFSLKELCARMGVDYIIH